MNAVKRWWRALLRALFARGESTPPIEIASTPPYAAAIDVSVESEKTRKRRSDYGQHRNQMARTTVLSCGRRR